jgi:hypothetical protein
MHTRCCVAGCFLPEQATDSSGNLSLDTQQSKFTVELIDTDDVYFIDSAITDAQGFSKLDRIAQLADIPVEAQQLDDLTFTYSVHAKSDNRVTCYDAVLVAAGASKPATQTGLFTSVQRKYGLGQTTITCEASKPDRAQTVTARYCTPCSLARSLAVMCCLCALLQRLCCRPALLHIASVLI